MWFKGKYKIHKRWKKEARGQGQREILGSYTDGFEDRERDHEPRNAGSFYKLEKARKLILPQSLSRKCSPTDPLILAQSDLFQTTDLQNSREEICVVLSHLFAVICHRSNRKLIHPGIFKGKKNAGNNSDHSGIAS